MPEPTVVKTISRSGGYEAVYLQHEDGTVTREVRRVDQPQPAPKRKRTRKVKEADQ